MARTKMARTKMARTKMARTKKAFNPPHFLVVNSAHARKRCFPTARQRNDNHPVVFVASLRAHQAVLFGPLHEAYNGVNPLMEKLGQLRNRGRASGISGHAKHQLVLLRRYPAVLGRVLAEAQEFSQGVSEPCQVANNRAHLGWTTARRKLLRVSI